MMTLGRPSGLAASEVHNYLLMEIQNRLAEISRFLEVITVKYADLDSVNVESITKDNKITGVCLTPNCPEENRSYKLRINNYRPIGYTDDKGLHIAEDDGDFYKLSNEKTARPVDNDNYFLTDKEIVDKWGKEGLEDVKKGLNPFREDVPDLKYKKANGD